MFNKVQTARCQEQKIKRQKPHNNLQSRIDNHVSGEPFEVSLEEISQFVMDPHTSKILDAAHMELVIELLPCGSMLKYLADVTTGEFRGSLEDLIAISSLSSLIEENYKLGFNYKQIPMKLSKHAQEIYSYIQETSLPGVLPVTLLSFEDIREFNNLTVEHKFLRSNLKSLETYRPLDKFDEQLQEFLIGQCETSVALISKNIESILTSVSRFNKNIEREQLGIPVWIFKLLSSNIIDLEGDSVSSLLFPNNILMGVTLRIKELSIPQITSSCEILTSGSEHMIWYVLNTTLREKFNYFVRQDYSETSSIILLPPIGLSKYKMQNIDALDISDPPGNDQTLEFRQLTYEQNINLFFYRFFAASHTVCLTKDQMYYLSGAHELHDQSRATAQEMKAALKEAYQKENTDKIPFLHIIHGSHDRVFLRDQLVLYFHLTIDSDVRITTLSQIMTTCKKNTAKHRDEIIPWKKFTRSKKSAKDHGQKYINSCALFDLEMKEKPYLNPIDVSIQNLPRIQEKPPPLRVRLIIPTETYRDLISVNRPDIPGHLQYIIFKYFSFFSHNEELLTHISRSICNDLTTIDLKPFHRFQ
jgi:hypothetical protein